MKWRSVRKRNKPLGSPWGIYLRIRGSRREGRRQTGGNLRGTVLQGPQRQKDPWIIYLLQFYIFHHFSVTNFMIEDLVVTSIEGFNTIVDLARCRLEICQSHTCNTSRRCVAEESLQWGFRLLRLHISSNVPCYGTSKLCSPAPNQPLPDGGDSR